MFFAGMFVMLVALAIARASDDTTDRIIMLKSKWEEFLIGKITIDEIHKIIKNL